jgi:exocyst complex component 4
LKDTVPGLVSGATTDPAQQTTLALAIDERFASAVQHRLIVPPDAFHVPVVFHPTLAFLERTMEILPSGLAEKIRASSGFLDEFVLKIYLPLLEEKVQGLFLKAVTGELNAFR